MAGTTVLARPVGEVHVGVVKINVVCAGGMRPLKSSAVERRENDKVGNFVIVLLGVESTFKRQQDRSRKSRNF